MATLPAGFPAMFGMGGGGGAPEPLVKFKAGRCELEPLSGAQAGSFNVTPVPKKGEVQVVRNDEGMTQFVWKDRTTMQVDPTCDHLVFPGDAQFEKIETGREADRVFSLQFTANRSRRFFFWMQDKDASKDEERVASVNAHINRTGDAAGAEAAASLSASSKTSVHVESCERRSSRIGLRRWRCATKAWTTPS